MRILAIRGRNLASLAETFEIDLAASPLADAGLFAITGDTGAGKSTILDALCLALYNNYPRVATKSDEKAPDPSGAPLASGDARAILRRGAAQGHAEVDFIGRDGRTYRARWEARRARAKADGKPQKVERQLTCLTDQTTIASSVTEVYDAVVTATGLTFDQFRRTVLLAQGEFDAFLLANENERAELLEKITGTEIYAEISKRVYASTKQRTETLAKLHERRVGIGGLDDTARTALAQLRDQQTATLALQAAEQAALATRIADTERLAILQQAATRAEIDVTSATAALTDAAADQQALAALTAVTPLLPLYDACRRADTQQHEAAQRHDHAQQLSAQANGTATTAAAALSQLTAAAAATERQVASLTPVWREAERLDTQVASARDETAQATAAHAAACTTAATAEADLAAIAQQHTTLTATHAKATATLAATAAHALLSQQAAPLADLLRQRARLTQQVSATATAVTQARTALQQLTTGMATTERRRTADLNAREQVAAQLARHRAELQAADEPAVLTAERHCQTLADTLHQALWLAQDYATTAATLARNQADSTTEAARHAAASVRLSTATTEHASVLTAREQLTALVDLADATASKAAIQMRSRLVPEQPCPVCGGEAHPYAHGTAADSALVAEIRQRRAALDACIAEAVAQINAANTEIAATTARQREADRAIKSAVADHAKAAAAFAKLTPKLANLIKPGDLTLPVPDALTPASATTFATLLEQVAARRLTLATARQSIDEMRTVCETLQPKLDALALAAETLRAELDAARDQHAQAQQSLAADTATLAGLTQQITAVNAGLTPYLAAAGLPPTHLDHDTTAQQLSQLGDAHRALTTEQATLTAALADLAPQQARALSQRDAANATVAKAAQALQSRQAQLAQMDATRAALLDGEATAAHRDRHLSAHTAAVASLDAARTVQAQAAAALAALTARAQDADAAATAAIASAAQSQAAFTAAIAEIDGTAPDADRLTAARRLLDTPAATVAALRSKIEALNRRLTDATTALNTRRADLADALAQAPTTEPAADLASLKTTAAALAAAIVALHGELAALAEQLRRDDQDRARSADLSAAIATTEADLAVWRDVDAAIGSAQGDKFRKFAQSITLDQLVRLANGQLAAINPRFTLVRSATSDLGLHMMDRDLGDDTRSIRSLSGGERFLVSLALALALSGLEGRQSFVDTLFIDEGFGSLDADTLDTAISALETLQSQGRKVGVITHVAAMIDRIAVAIRVEKRGPGRSVVRLDDGTQATWGMAA